MVKIISVTDLQRLVRQQGLKQFFIELIAHLREDFARWPEFKKTPRHATHYPHGVIELMPISDNQYYTFKYVNGHPSNPEQQKLNVVALGLLADVASGYPLLVSEMTLLTALRTAATSALAATYLAPAKSRTMSIIGTGSQAEFQVLAHHYALGINNFKYYDRDPAAMTKFADSLASYGLNLTAGRDIPTTIADTDIITTATAAKVQAKILEDRWIKPGVYINAIGGDCPGKTELDPQILTHSKIVVENLIQTRQEGEIQHIDNGKVYAELWEIVSGHKPGRQNSTEIFVFDSVGFALEDYSTLRYVYSLAQAANIGQELNLLPELHDPKNLFSLLR